MSWADKALRKNRLEKQIDNAMSSPRDEEIFGPCERADEVCR